MLLFGYFGWRKGEPIRRLKFLLIYGCVIFTMGLFQWATAPPTYLAEPPSQPTTEQVGTNFICICIALYGAWKLGGRLRDTSIKWYRDRNFLLGAASMGVTCLLGVSTLFLGRCTFGGLISYPEPSANEDGNRDSQAGPADSPDDHSKDKHANGTGNN